MYLKSIEVQGFKSFAHKITFNFHKGITGIVGPNGCGKSNVADAVRWVLGEQRARQLRGDSMQDVIFSGTENRKPLSFASVSLTLDNHDHQIPIDYEEVTVTRRLYRSGESEYLLNGAACRLRDVNELFYDTGIGQEGYSIIGQGQIDQILSGKPEERRELFDEAAGIVKFKRRKSLSLKKLDDEEQNLLRVNDILEELTGQLAPLKEQADTARTYLAKKEELKVQDINVFLLETDRLKEQIQGVEEKLKVTHGELDQAQADYEKMKREYESVETQVDEIDAAIEQANGQLNETNLLKQQLENQIELLKEQIHSAQVSDEHQSDRMKTIEAEMEDRRASLSQNREEQSKIQSDLEQEKSREAFAQSELTSAQEKTADIRASLEDTQKQIVDLLNDRALAQANSQKYDTLLEQAKEQKAALAEQMAACEKEEKELEEREKEHRKALSDLSLTIQKKQEEKDSLLAQIDARKKEAADAAEDLRKAQTAYHKEQSRLESMQNMAERYEGYGNSIRKVMDQREKEPGILGVVSDLIQTEKKYETAVETALGSSVQHIVTADEDTAKRMITFLKEGRFGRATFLPLQSLRASEGIRHPEAEREPGAIGCANTLVQVDARYQVLADYLLGRTLVVDTIDAALAIARKYNQSIRMVTLEGELISPGGSISGGAFKNKGNLLGRRREIEESTKQVARFQEEMDACAGAVDQLAQEQDACQRQVNDLSASLQDDYVARNTEQMQADQAKESLQDAQKRRTDDQNEAENLDQQIAHIIQQKDEAAAKLTGSQSSEKELNEQVASANQALSQAEEEENEKQQAALDIHIRCVSLTQSYDYAVSNGTRLEEELDKFQAELDALNESRGGASQEILEKEAQIKDLTGTIENSGELFTEIQAQIEEYKTQREDLNRKNKDFLQNREDLSSKITQLDKEVFRLESQKTNYEESSDKQIDYMWEEYELTYNQALKIRDENLTDLSKMKKRIQALKGEIKDLGDVNVNAIEDYKNLQERYTFLKGQHDDLVAAADSLHQIIDDLDDQMRKQFTEQFARIADEFDAVFQELFGGGKGTLELMDAEDVLEAGIRITAQPPGKKLQNIMQLSGGEKALTAIALLFAIQNLKPSPFCLLDEIEAALDDNNVERFANYLKKLSSHTQFIVITHRRGTMTAADQLYGITMQEKGVSTLVSVNLLQDELS